MSNTMCRWVSMKLAKPPTEYLLEHEKRIIEEHLQDCLHCSDLKELSDEMRQWAKLSAPAVSPFKERKIITDALEGRMPGSSREPLFAGRLAPWMAVAGIAAAVVIAFVLFWPGAQDNGEQSNELRQQVAKKIETETIAPKAYNLIQFEKSTPVKLMREDKVWGTEHALVNLNILSNELTRIELIQGRIVVEVTKRKAGEKFEVVGPGGVVEVVGTIFSVEVDDLGVQHVRVLRGKVKVNNKRSGKTSVVSKNHQLTIGDDKGSVIASKQELDSDRELMGTLKANIRSAQAGNNGSRGAAKDKSSRTEQNATKLAQKAIKEKRLGEARRHIEEAQQSDTQSQDVPDLLARLARAYRQQQNYAAAEAIYKQLIGDYSRTTAAQNAMVALAQLELNALGKPNVALAYFDTYLASVPSGYLSETALIGKARALRQIGNDSALFQTSNNYLAKFGKGSFASEMLLYRGQIHQQTGKCGLAQKDFKAIITRWPDSRKATQAREGLAACGTN
ncbi:MAG: FecR domain-containing protein [Deltaproteobacteria bacterium]|nr:FecR domain-containing protein [Deltaproteobacteria bacterium]